MTPPPTPHKPTLQRRLPATALSPSRRHRHQSITRRASRTPARPPSPFGSDDAPPPTRQFPAERACRSPPPLPRLRNLRAAVWSWVGAETSGRLMMHASAASSRLETGARGQGLFDVGLTLWHPVNVRRAWQRGIADAMPRMPCKTCLALSRPQWTQCAAWPPSDMDVSPVTPSRQSRQTRKHRHHHHRHRHPSCLYTDKDYSRRSLHRGLEPPSRGVPPSSIIDNTTPPSLILGSAWGPFRQI